MLSLSSVTLGFAPGAAPHALQLPALVHMPRPAMVLDGTVQWLADAAASAPVLLPPDSAASTVAEAAAEDPGWFDLVVVKPFETAILALHGALQGAGVEGAFGISIILFTLGLKLLTFPLTKTQIESTSKMQAIQPAAKKLQEKYRDRDPARLNMELQKLYTENQVNPLAGCLPSLAQIPIFIGLYRSVLNLAKEDKLTESFLWLPSLEGPVADYKEGAGWLFGNADVAKGTIYAWNGLTPPLGWHDTLCYLVLPLTLIASQYVSTSILTPKSDDPAQQQSQAILKFLPLMIGWFSLNVPSGLGLYWLTNNIVTTASTVLIRRSVGTPDLAAATSGGGSTSTYSPPKSQGFTPAPREVIEKTDDAGTKVTISPPGSSKRSARRKAAAAAAAAGGAAEATVVDVSAAAISEASAAPAAIPVPEADASVDASAPSSKKKKKRAKKNKK
jgi:YidC/Oxa1 family membrane protein insertase